MLKEKAKVTFHTLFLDKYAIYDQTDEAKKNRPEPLCIVPNSFRGLHKPHT